MPVFSLAPISGILQFPPPASPPPSPLAFLLPDSLQCFVQSVRSSFRAWVLPASSVSTGPLWSTQPCKGDSVTGRLALKPPGIWRFFPVPRGSHPDSLFISSKERNSGWILPPVPFPVRGSRPLRLFFPFLFFSSRRPRGPRLFIFGSTSGAMHVQGSISDLFFSPALCVLMLLGFFLFCNIVSLQPILPSSFLP